jgi:hypothetical protein
VPAGNEVVVMVNGAPARIRILSALDAVRVALSVTVTVKFEFPVVVGVPLIVPELLKSRPPGSAPADTRQVVPPIAPETARVWE